MGDKPGRTIALLGATGSTGGAILSQLLLRPASSLHINIYVRSPERLQAKHPKIKETSNVSIFSGSMSSSSLKPCLKNADVILNAIGSNKPIPGQSLTQEAAAAIITALQELSKDNKRSTKVPHVVILSSGSCNEVFYNNEPWFTKKLLWTGLYYTYEDLRLATIYYRKEGVDTGILHLSVACPGGLAELPAPIDTPIGRGEGVRLSLTEYTPMVTYQELARGMIEMGDNPDEWAGKEALLLGAQPPAYGQILSLVVRNVIPGIMITYIPSLYPILCKIGWL